MNFWCFTREPTFVSMCSNDQHELRLQLREVETLWLGFSFGRKKKKNKHLKKTCLYVIKCHDCHTRWNCNTQLAEKTLWAWSPRQTEYTAGANRLQLQLPIGWNNTHHSQIHSAQDFQDLKSQGVLVQIFNNMSRLNLLSPQILPYHLLVFTLTCFSTGQHQQDLET